MSTRQRCNAMQLTLSGPFFLPSGVCLQEMTADAIPISLVRICKSCCTKHPEKDALALVSKSKAKEVSFTLLWPMMRIHYSKHE